MSIGEAGGSARGRQSLRYMRTKHELLTDFNAWVWPLDKISSWTGAGKKTKLKKLRYAELYMIINDRFMSSFNDHPHLDNAEAGNKLNSSSTTETKNSSMNTIARNWWPSSCIHIPFVSLFLLFSFANTTHDPTRPAAHCAPLSVDRGLLCRYHCSSVLLAADFYARTQRSIAKYYSCALLSPPRSLKTKKVYQRINDQHELQSTVQIATEPHTTYST